MRPDLFRLPLVTFSCVFAFAALAQTKDAPKAPATVASPAGPERTTASFGDWILRCENVGAPAKRVCEVAQVVTLQGQTNPIAQIALGRAAPNEPMRITMVLPTNITILAKPKISIGKDGGASSELTWQNCTAAGCFASTAITDATIAAFANQSEPGRMVFKDAAGRDIALPLSFRGLSEAVSALSKEM